MTPSGNAGGEREGRREMLSGAAVVERREKWESLSEGGQGRKENGQES